MSIVRSESLLDTILPPTPPTKAATPNVISPTDSMCDGVHNTDQGALMGATNSDHQISNPLNGNSNISILSPNPTEENLALASLNNAAKKLADVSSFDTLANRTRNEGVDSGDAHQRPVRRNKIQSFIEFDDDDDYNSCHAKNNAHNGTNGQRMKGAGGRRLLTNGKSFDYSYCDNIELADVFSVSAKPSNDEPLDNDDVEWANFQSSETVPAQQNDENDAEVCNAPPEVASELSDEIETEVEDDDDDEYEENGGGYEPEEENDENVYNKLEKMEAEQEMLNNSLLALTSHFAKVQFRIKQIVNSGEELKAEEKENLLKDLEAFANRGIPELMSGTSGCGASTRTPGSTSGCPSIAGRLERTTSMATSLMADDVFDDDLETDIGDDSVTADTMGVVTEAKLEKQRSRQKELIERLKDQLEDLERYAYETGDIADLPSSMLLERQNAIIEQLRSKLPVLTIDEIDKLSPEQLRIRVDQAVRELVSPVLMKEQLVAQLKTQVTDLERFIEFLQQAQGKKIKNGLDSGLRRKMNQFLKLRQETRTGSDSQKSSRTATDRKKNQGSSARPGTARTAATTSSTNKAAATTSTTNHANIIRRIISLLQVFAWTQIGSCASFKYPSSQVPNTHQPTHQHPTSQHAHHRAPFERNALKRQTRHYGDLRAHLEMSIDRLVQFAQQIPSTSTAGDETRSDQNGQETSNDHEEDFISLGETKLVINNYFHYEQMNLIVRKDFAVALRNLIQHGLKGALTDTDDCDQPTTNGYHRAAAPMSRNKQSGSTTLTGASGAMQPASNGSLLAFGLGCFGLSSRTPALNLAAPIGSMRPTHAWEVILFYYDLKNGARLRSDSSRRLSQSFGLQVVAGMNVANPKHSLLVAIDDIIDSHTRLKRSLDAHFKAFICVALNQKMLSQWLRLIVRNARIVSDCYERWSYASSTGFEDALRQMDKLGTLKFCLPTDIAVRQLQSIHDAF